MAFQNMPALEVMCPFCHISPPPEELPEDGTPFEIDFAVISHQGH